MYSKLTPQGSIICRVGIGLDVHAFDMDSSSEYFIASKTPTKQNIIYLCGIPIPHDFTVLAHSDGDVALHALTDAMLGSVAAGSIGQHFPPSDQRWKNARSEIFVRHALKILRNYEETINNIDMTIVCELPKIMPHAHIMNESLAHMLEIDVSQVNVKAVTTEKLGFLGRKEGIAAQVICMISMPSIRSS